MILEQLIYFATAPNILLKEYKVYKQSHYNQFVKYDDKYILYNFLTSALLEIDKDYFYKKLKNQDENDEEFLLLREFGFITKKHDQTDEIYDTYNFEKFNSKSMNITIELTNSCNFRCKYCYQEHLTSRIDNRKANSIIKLIRNNINKGLESLHIHWFGGEPTLNIQTAVYIDNEIHKACKENDVRYTSSMTTNGYNIKENYTYLKSMNINNFQITLDGIDEYHNFTRHLENGEGTFNKILENIKFLDSKGYRVIIRYNVNKRNHNIKNFIDLLRNENLSSNVSLHIQGTNEFENSLYADNLYFENTKEYSDYLLNIYNTLSSYSYAIPKYKNYGTNCPFDCMNNFYINSNLDILRCSSCDSSKDSIIGTLVDGEVILNEKSYDSKENYIGLNKEKCYECKLLPICKGGCYLKHSLGQDECIAEKYFIEDYVRLIYEEAIR